MKVYESHKLLFYDNKFKCKLNHLHTFHQRINKHKKSSLKLFQSVF